MINYVIKAALFDLDGVVAFTDKYHYLAWKKVSDEQGWEFDEEINNKLRGIPRMASLEVILNHNGVNISEEEKELIAKCKNDYYVELLKEINESDIYSGVLPFIAKLREKGVKTAICSSSKNADAVLKYLNIESYFDAVVTGNDIQRAKPDPQVFTMGAEKLGIPPYHCVVFEDAYTGIQGAKAAGMRNCGVGNSETEDIADEFIRDYREIDIECFLESGRKDFFKADGYHLHEKPFKKGEVNHTESIFALGNGYIGMRGTYEEEDTLTDAIAMPGMYINGVFETEDFNHPWFYKGYAKSEQYTANLTDWRLISVYVDGEKACFSNGKMLEHDRYLDMKEGSLKRSFIWESERGKQIKVNSVRIVNMECVHSAVISYDVTPLNFSGNIEIFSEERYVNDTNGKNFTEKISAGRIGRASYALISTKNTKIKTAAAVINDIVAESYKTSEEITDNIRTCRIEVYANEGEKVILNKYAAFYSDVDDVPDIIESAAECVEKCADIGFSDLRDNQSAFWERHWETGNIKIKGNPNDDLAVRFNLFHTRQQIPTINGMSVGATGLTGPQYSGKVFWDTEIYVMPYINYTKPEAIREMLMFRYRTLDKARERAKEMDGKGALFAWATIDGAETSTCLEASTAEYHLESDIAYAINRYYRSTNDKEFMFDYGAEILFDTAVFMYDLGRYIPYNDNKFCLNGVCGPDEYAGAVNNNCYTNMMLKFHFEFACEIYALMKKEAPEKLQALTKKLAISEVDTENWKKAAENMYDGYNEKLGIHEQDSAFLYKNPVNMSEIPQHVSVLGLETNMLNVWRMQLVKQADVVLLMLLMGNNYTLEQKKANFDFYEPKTNHGSSLSPAVYSIEANEIGDTQKAYSYFRSSAYMDLCDFKHNTAGGLHLACLGGVWMTVANGFLGMRDYSDKLVFNPSIPDAWDEYELSINYRGSVINITVNHDKAVFALKSGKKVSFECFGTDYTLSEKLEISKER